MVHDLIIVGAVLAGISTAVEAREAGIGRERILILEKGRAHSYVIRKFYPEDKRLDAVYKGIPAISEGGSDHPTLGAERPLRRRCPDHPQAR